MFELYTCGYTSFKGVDELLEVMERNKVKLLVDVRSSPYSKHFESYNREKLKEYLEDHGKAYEYMGDRLGGRRVKGMVLQGIKNVEDLLSDGAFKEGMRELYILCKEHKRCLIMCAEKEPERCHRFLAIGYLFMKRAKDVQVFNLIGRSLESGHDTFKRLKGHSPELRERFILHLLGEVYEEEEIKDKSQPVQKSLF